MTGIKAFKIVIILLLFLAATGAVFYKGNLTIAIEEQDGDPSGVVYKIKVTNGALTISDNVGTVTTTASTTHATTHNNGGADEVTIDPSQVPCNEGLNAQGSSTNVLECSATVPNLVTTLLPGTDDTWSGPGAYTATAGYGTTVQWEAVHFQTNAGNNKWEKADANVATLWPAYGLATAAVAEDAVLVVVYEGCVRNDGWNGSFTHGDLLFLSETPGGLTATAPTDSGDLVQPIGRFYDLGTDCYLCLNVNHVSGWATVP
jgi:hypothetical protein